MRIWMIYNIRFPRWFSSGRKALWIFHCVRCASRLAGFSFVSLNSITTPLLLLPYSPPILSFFSVSRSPFHEARTRCCLASLSLFLALDAFACICISTIEYASLTHSLSLLICIKQTFFWASNSIDNVETRCSSRKAIAFRIAPHPLTLCSL